MNALRTTAIGLFLVATNSVLATQLNLDQLGNLETGFQPVIAVQEVSGMPLSAEVSTLPNAAYQITSPVPYRRLTLLHVFGTHLEENQPFAVLQGPELHHFHEEYAFAQQQYSLEQKRYQRAQNLVDANAMDANTFLEIVKSRNSAELAVKHYEHFFRWTSEDANAGEDALTLRTPAAGVLIPPSTQEQETDYPIAALLPPDQMRLQVHIPARTTEKIHAVQLENCRVPMRPGAGHTQGLYRTQYSDPIGPDCRVDYGQTLSVTPLIEKTAWQVPDRAVFSFEEQFYIWRKQDQSIIATPVQPLGRNDQGILVQSEIPLSDTQVLITSVSAAHGILLGLGEE